MGFNCHPFVKEYNQAGIAIVNSKTNEFQQFNNLAKLMLKYKIKLLDASAVSHMDMILFIMLSSRFIDEL